MMIVPENQTLTYPDEISRSLKQLKLDFKPIKSSIPTIKTITANRFNSPQSIEDNLSFLYPFMTKEEIRATLRDNNHNADEAKASILRKLNQDKQANSDKKREEPLLSKKRMLTEINRNFVNNTNQSNNELPKTVTISLSDKVKMAAIKIIETNSNYSSSVFERELKQVMAPLISGNFIYYYN